VRRNQPRHTYSSCFFSFIISKGPGNEVPEADKKIIIIKLVSVIDKLVTLVARTIAKSDNLPAWIDRCDLASGWRTASPKFRDVNETFKSESFLFKTRRQFRESSI